MPELLGERRERNRERPRHILFQVERERERRGGGGKKPERQGHFKRDLVVVQRKVSLGTTK